MRIGAGQTPEILGDVAPAVLTAGRVVARVPTGVIGMSVATIVCR